MISNAGRSFRTLSSIMVAALMLPCVLWGGRAEAGTRRLRIYVFPTYGSFARLVVRGRVLKEVDTRPVTGKDSRWRNFKRTAKRFLTVGRRVRGVRLLVRVAGRRVVTFSDRRGRFSVTVRPKAKNLPSTGGAVDALVCVAVKKKSKGKRVTVCDGESEGQGTVYLAGRGGGLSVITDIDDTVLHTGVGSKGKMVLRTLFKNYLQIRAVSGAATFLRAFGRAAGEQRRGLVHYVSASPENLYPRLLGFLRSRYFPAGPVDLRRFSGKGLRKLLNPTEYKLRRLRAIFRAFPRRRFVLVGDSGEKDPEVYLGLRKLYPRRVAAIYIRKCGKVEPKAARFKGMFLFSRYSEALKDARQRGLLSRARRSKVGK